MFPPKMAKNSGKRKSIMPSHANRILKKPSATELCALAAAYAALHLHGGVAAPAHLDGP